MTLQVCKTGLSGVLFGFVLGLISFSQHFCGMLSLAFTGDLKPGRERVTSLIKSMPKVIKIQKEELFAK